MAGMNEEEDYLHRLLENAMMQDAAFEKEENKTDGVSEETESEQELILDEGSEEDFFSVPEEDNPEDMLALEDDFGSESLSETVSDEYGDMSDDELFSLDELMNSAQEEDTVTEEAPESEEWETDGTESDYLNELKDIVEAEPGQDETDIFDGFGQEDADFGSETDGLTENQDFADVDDNSPEGGELEDILALDEGGSFTENDGESDENEVPEHIYLPDDEEAGDSLAAEEEENIFAPDSEEPAKNSKKSKSKNKAKKDKKQKKEKGDKKFSLKGFFMDYDEDDSENKAADANQQLIDELYEGKSSLDDADPNDIDGSTKKKKEKKVKEKKEKPKKEPKPKKVKEPKDTAQKGGFDVGLLFKALLIAAVLVAAFIFGSRFFTYRSTVKSAREYFDSGNYSAAYNRLSGVKVKNRDNDLYMKTRAVMTVYQGIESYENYIALDDVPHALDALIMAVGRKNRNEENAVKYEVTNEVNGVYNRVIGMLERYGISETQALEYFTMKDYDKYFAILEDIGGHGVDSNN